MIGLLSIGIDRYEIATRQQDELEDLGYGNSDAQRVRSTLKSLLPVEHDRLLNSTEVGDRSATRNNILRELVELRKGKPDVVLVYFAGHGVDIGGRFHLCPQDYDPRIPQFSAIGVTDIAASLGDIALTAVMVIDACRAPRDHRKAELIQTRWGSVAVPDNVCLLLACSNTELAFETPSINGKAAGGVFTHFLGRELARGSTSQKTRYISVGAAFSAAQKKTSVFAAQKLGSTQTPRSVGMYPHDIFLERRRDNFLDRR